MVRSFMRLPKFTKALNWEFLPFAITVRVAFEVQILSQLNYLSVGNAERSEILQINCFELYLNNFRFPILAVNVFSFYFQLLKTEIFLD